MSEQYTAPDVLARRLDQALPPGKNFIPPVTPDPLVNTAVEIAKLPVPGLTQAASTRIETRLLAAFDQQNPARQPRVLQRPRQTSGIVARWALAACAALVLLFAGLTPSVNAAVPGEPLYTVKQFYERVELATAFTPSAQASVYLQHANRRADEALTLLERNQFDPSLANAVLTNIAEASKSAAEIRKSPRLRGQLYQADLLLTFVVQNAHESGLTTGDEFLRLAQEVEQIGASDLLLPADSPDEGVTVEITPESLDEAEIAETLEPTPEVTAEFDRESNRRFTRQQRSAVRARSVLLVGGCARRTNHQTDAQTNQRAPGHSANTTQRSRWRQLRQQWRRKRKRELKRRRELRKWKWKWKWQGE